MLDERTPYPGSFQQLADARRALKVATTLDKHPVLQADERLALQQVKSLAIRTIEAATEELIATLDALHDADVEPNGDEADGTNAEDDFLGETVGRGAELDGPGCPISDAGEYATPEDIRQREFKRSLPNEDA
jgi:hypothetical protein